MLSEKLISYLKSMGWWFEDAPQDYINGLIMLNVDINSQFAQFFLHAEDGPSFNNRHGQIHQVCWHIINTNYFENSKRLLNAINLPNDYLPLDSFEGEGGYFYKKSDGSVVLHKLSASNTSPSGKWGSMDEFMCWFFDL